MTGAVIRRIATAGVSVLVLTAAVDANPQRASRPLPPPAARVPINTQRTVRVGVLRQGTYTVRSVPLEEYVAGVLVGEALPDSPPALLDALAVAIRTYALKNLDRHGAEGFDVCDQTHCQVLRTANDATAQAAARTAGQVLTWRGALATVYYSASCGGHTEVPSAVWPGSEDVPYLPSRKDDGCGGTPEWTIELRAIDLARQLNAAGLRGSLKGLRIAGRDASGRVTALTAEGLTPNRISGQDFRMALGPQSLKSTAFDLQKSGTGYRFTGRGYGHGVGMCVIGATRLASVGESAPQLLTRYFPGTTLGPIDAAAPGMPPAAPVITTSSAAPASRSASAPAAVPTEAAPAVNPLDALAARARADVALVLRVTPPPALPFQVHASGAEYERATGRDWFTLASVVNGAIHLMPIDQLEQRGVLDRVVRREIVRSVVDVELAGRPLWVRVGAALFFSGPRADDVEVKGSCPADAELERPLSAGALSQAYARARACFAKQIESGRSWRDVR